MNPHGIAIILGSESDQRALEESKTLEILSEVGVPYDVSVISAHRNPKELETYCADAAQGGAKVFIGIAGMSAALPGAIASVLASSHLNLPVIGVPLPSSEFADGQDALLSMVRMPPGMPVAVCGIGKSGLRNAALMACQILAVGNSDVRDRLNAYALRALKPAKISVLKSSKA